MKSHAPDAVIQDAGSPADEYKKETEKCSKYIVNNMYHCCSALIRFCADAAHQISGDAVTDIYTDDDCENSTECDTDRACHRLYDTYYSR